MYTSGESGKWKKKTTGRDDDATTAHKAKEVEEREVGSFSRKRAREKASAIRNLFLCNNSPNAGWPAGRPALAARPLSMLAACARRARVLSNAALALTSQSLLEASSDFKQHSVYVLD